MPKRQADDDLVDENHGSSKQPRLEQTETVQVPMSGRDRQALKGTRKTLSALDKHTNTTGISHTEENGDDYDSETSEKLKGLPEMAESENEFSDSEVEVDGEIMKRKNVKVEDLGRLKEVVDAGYARAWKQANDDEKRRMMIEATSEIVPRRERELAHRLSRAQYDSKHVDNTAEGEADLPGVIDPNKDHGGNFGFIPDKAGNVLRHLEGPFWEETLRNGRKRLYETDEKGRRKALKPKEQKRVYAELEKKKKEKNAGHH